MRFKCSIGSVAHVKSSMDPLKVALFFLSCLASAIHGYTYSSALYSLERLGKNALFEISDQFEGPRQLKRRYLLSRDKETRSLVDAQQTCAAVGATLARISSQEEHDFVSQFLTRFNSGNGVEVFIGGNDNRNENSFVYNQTGAWSLIGGGWNYRQADDALDPVEFYNWDVDDNEPDGGRRQNCLALWSKKSWKLYDIPCDQSQTEWDRRFLCQFDESPEIRTMYSPSYWDILWVNSSLQELRERPKFWYSEKYNRKQYLLSKFHVHDLDNAAHRCGRVGGVPVEINDVSEFNFIVEFLETTKESEGPLVVMTGANDEAEEGSFVFRGSGQHVTYFNWNEADNEPDGGEYQNCVFLWSEESFLMYDMECEEQSLFAINVLCEVDSVRLEMI